MKYVHWQLPFSNNKNEQYRIDIYADGECASPTQLTGGASPFVTDEDNSNDFFKPIRSQTGRISIIDTEGTILNQLMPVDNVKHPVRLIRVSDGAIMWQGFLSCETYNQAYTNRPNEFTMNVNSVLETMGSVEFDISLSAFHTVRDMIMWMLNYLSVKVDMLPFVSHYYVPSNSIDILNKYIDTTVFFDVKRNDNENRSTYKSVGISMLDVLTKLCQYMGWTAREAGNKIYMTDGSNRDLIGFVYDSQTYEYEQSTTEHSVRYDMSNQEWMGAGHQIETSQGAKSVEVVARVDDYDPKMSIPECPPTSTSMTKTWQLSDGKIMSISGSTDTLAHNNVEIAFPTIYGKILQDVIVNYGEDTLMNMYRSTLLYQGAAGSRYTSVQSPSQYATFIAGAFFARGELRDTSTIPDLQDGMYMAFFPYVQDSPAFNPANTKPILKMRSVNHTRLNGGYLRLQGDYFGLFAYNNNRGILSIGELSYLSVTLKIGDRYWNDSTRQWTSTESIFKLGLYGGSFVGNWNEDMHILETDGYLIPVNDEISGEIELWVWPQVTNSFARPNPTSLTLSDYFNEAFFKSFNLDYVVREDYRDSHRSENHYYQVLGLSFRDEVVIQTDLASDLNNKPSPSILMNSQTETMKYLTYADGTVDRPERILLERLASYYRHARRRITIEIERPEGLIPLIRFSGFDGKTYLPLAESRDWKTGTSTIKCFEVP